MKIIIAGDGKVGSMLTSQLSGEGHDLILIDQNPDALESTMERYDVMSVEGNCASMEVLRNAGVETADLLITATGEDELNLLCCMTAHGMNPNLHTIARIRKPDYAESAYAMRKIFALSLTVNPERQTAREIDRLLRYPGFLRREKFANGMVEIVELKVEQDSPLKDHALYDLGSITHCQVLVCAVVRGGVVEIPSGDFVMHQGDRLFVTASAKNLSILLHSLGYVTQKVRSVMILGGGRNCHYLTSLLLKEGIDVKIIEINQDRCEHLAETFPSAVIVQGDVSHSSVLDRENIGGMDAVISMTGIDELNVITSLYADSLRVPKVITKLGRAENLGLLHSLPVGSIVSPKELCCNSIVTYVRAMQDQVGAAVTMHSIADGQAEAIEFIADAGTPHLGQPLREMKLKKNILITSITRGRSIIFPNGDTSFEAGDRIIIVSNGITLHQLNDIFE